jgi:cell division protein FtsL
MNRNQKSANRKLSEWIDQGLKKAHWSPSRLTRVGLIIVISAAFAVLYLVQSSQLVTAQRQVENLRAELTQLQQDNALLAVQISAENSIGKLRDRAERLGFEPATELLYLSVKSQPVDDAPTLQSVYAP